MTTTDADLNINDIFTPAQAVRLAALQGVSEFTYVLPENAVSAGVLIDLAEYVIGDDEPFDPVAEAHKAMAAIRAERGEDYNGYDDEADDYADYDDGEGAYEDGPLADWERELLGGGEEPVVGDITVSDLAGFDTLPGTAVLMDVDGDAWHYGFGRGWTYAGSDIYRSAHEVFSNLGDENGEFDFVVTNPEVLA